MKFFFDRNISVHIARMMGHFERVHTVVHQDDDNRFEDDAADEDIIDTLASESPKPIWVTADIKQLRGEKERAALGSSGMTIFFFKGFHKNKLPHLQALKVLAVWPAIVDAAETARVPTAFEIPLGRIYREKLIDKIVRLGPTDQMFIK